VLPLGEYGTFVALSPRSSVRHAAQRGSSVNRSRGIIARSSASSGGWSGEVSHWAAGPDARSNAALRTFMAWHRASGRRDPAGFRFPQELFRLGVAGAKPGFNPGIDFTLDPTDPPLADMDRPWKPTADD